MITGTTGPVIMIYVHLAISGTGIGRNAVKTWNERPHSKREASRRCNCVKTVSESEFLTRRMLSVRDSL